MSSMLNVHATKCSKQQYHFSWSIKIFVEGLFYGLGLTYFSFRINYSDEGLFFLILD